MNKTELENEWLLNNSIVAFVGVILVAQSWQIAERAINLHIFGMITVPGFIYSISGSMLFIVSIVFLLAKFLPALRKQLLTRGPLFSPVLGLLLAAALFVSLPTAILDLDLTLDLSPSLFLLSLLLVLFILVRAICQYFRLFVGRRK